MHRPTRAETTRAQLRLAAIREEISGRLWPVNAGMSSAAYNEMMDGMSLLQLNAESRCAGGPAHLDTRLGPLDRRSVGVSVPAGGNRRLP
jgi:hypothetical protein